MATFNLKQHGLDVEDVRRNLAPARLYEEAVRYEKDAAISNKGALIVRSGEKKGRSPLDKRIVENPQSRDDIWWGPINMKIDEHTFDINHQRACDYLNTLDRLYVVDGYAGWDPNYRLKVRIITERPYHAL
ncbi:MAG: phosphoenolpyruvate carboxykinase (ATP), partial [Bacteroidetes bacterium]|nr:phosphoenolpyruvate carboxykinase (ATP) [Bacteroidota bacterium]